MNEVFLLKMGEMVLKGLNRGSFERRLLDNTARALKPYGHFDISSLQSTVTVTPAQNADAHAAFLALRRVFGYASICRAVAVDKNMDAVCQTAAAYLAPVLNRAASFKAEAKRSDKAFPLTSPQISAALGAFLHENFPNLRVDVRNPDITVTAEIRDKAYIHADPVKGAGGLPYAMGGRAALLLSGGIDSPVAGYMCARRGVELCAVHFFSYPYTSEAARDKVIALARELCAYCGLIDVIMVPFTRVQEAIRAACPEDLFTLIMRRFMVRIATTLAETHNCGALITGESLGQVASQTMQALAVTDSLRRLPALRPLIGMDKEDIVKISREIGTYPISILPHEDCCTVFTPKHPKTKPRLADIEAAEAMLDVGALCQNALDAVEVLRLGR